jgi:60 kDa SS-A/Ro ribonucleoprotein
MANKSLFASMIGALLPRTDAQNFEQAPAYGYTPRHKLAQLAVTGTLNATFYASAREQLEDVLAVAREVEPAFLAKAAIYGRERGYRGRLKPGGGNSF